ncbi:class I SAM-dependent methyltransferase [Microtetraspora malaysiensis]|uniref:class I SAM-dependent methyltransferase n=1 Tax=Microtetraspora malaysiensis TaxID=161358 RepID=UPI003D8A3988
MREVPEDDAPARDEHWEAVYRERGPRQVSWFQADPLLSVELVEAAAEGDTSAPVIDVGGGASLLAAHLTGRGFTDVTVLDLSKEALEISYHQDVTRTVSFIHGDLLTWNPERRYRIWHDRAVFHFLTRPGDRAVYRAVLRRALEPGGRIILAAFAPDGPTHCSGLPVARYSAEELAAELGDAFIVTGTRTEQHHTPAGAVQPFTWITARLR